MVTGGSKGRVRPITLRPSAPSTAIAPVPPGVEVWATSGVKVGTKAEWSVAFWMSRGASVEVAPIDDDINNGGEKSEMRTRESVEAQMAAAVGQELGRNLCTMS